MVDVLVNPPLAIYFFSEMQSGNEKTRLQVELQDVVLPKISYITIPPYLRYAADEIHIGVLC